MLIHPRRALSVLTSSLTLSLVVLLAIPSWAAEKARLRVDDYQIEAELDPHLHQITARAKVKFTALQDLSVAVFELHNDLRVTKVLDEKNQPLSAERVTQDSTVRVPLPAGLSKDASTTLTFEYEGPLENADNSPVPGLKLAYIGDDTSYLLYAGRWFPVSGYGLNRFTSTISVTVPAHMLVIGSGQSPLSILRLRRSPTPACCRPRLSRSSPPSPVSPARSLPEFFRSTRATKPAWTCTSFSSPRIRAWLRPTPRRRCRSSPTSSRSTACRLRRS